MRDDLIRTRFIKFELLRFPKIKKKFHRKNCSLDRETERNFFICRYSLLFVDIYSMTIARLFYLKK